MEDFFNSNLFLTIISVSLFLILVWNAFLQWQNQKIKKKMEILFEGKKAKDLEKLIFEIIERLDKGEKDVSDLKKFDKYLEEMALLSIQKVGIIRYNPFKEAGGDQSFSIVLLDSQNNGFVITSLYGRETSRVYAKPVENGTSKYQLSEEERKVIEEATSS